ncbi:insulinase family protein [Shewanella abyssi]|uniref:M16 family metallopeptidase n=1 Tax=Shewanella abyssi TaxID=311789 RepID=UPI00200E354E|nr:insulinase family protein [Shewanella abyssi]MCL1051776.1 insulinase family protein [Shewanella abyssi]
MGYRIRTIAIIISSVRISSIKISAIKATTISLVAYLGLTLLGCQQTQIDFTDTSAASLPQFTPIKGAPAVEPMRFEQTHTAQQQALPNGSKLFMLNDQKSGLDHLTLVAYSPKQPFTNVDVLIRAFEEKRRWLVANTALSCAQSLTFRPSLHSIAIGISCHQLPTEASELLISFWQANSFDNIDIANVRRQLKLAKHINAFSGAEINTVWAKTILGEQHIYNQALNDSSLADSLTLESLNQIREQIQSQADWAVLTNPKLLQDNREQPQTLLAAALELNNTTGIIKDDNQHIEAQPLSVVPLGNSSKTLYIIDAPGSVQTQVRIGYPLTRDLKETQVNQPLLPSQASTGAQDCQILASWLGRSFSGRLYYDLREVRGLTYGIYGRCYDNPLSRTIKFYGSTKLQHTGAFIDGVLKHLALAAESPASQAELTAVKTYNTSKLLLRQDNPMALEVDTIRQLTSGYSPLYPQEFAANIDALTAERLQTIAAKVFSRSPYIVIRGDADKISADLQQKLPDWQLIEVSAN